MRTERGQGILYRLWRTLRLSDHDRDEQHQ
jgi:hypothetical protein